MSDGSVVGTPRKTKYQLDQQALDMQTGVQKVDKVFRDPSVQFQLVPENDWSAVDAKTMGMSTPDILKLQQGGAVETTITGTDTGTGSRSAPAPAPAPVARDRMAGATDYERYAAWAKANPTLAAKVKPGQAGYKEVQQYLNPTTDDDVTAFSDDSGHSKDESEAILKGGSVETVIDSSGIKSTVNTPGTTSNPESSQDGASPYADMSDIHRTVEIPGYDPQKFLDVKLQEILGDVAKKYSDPGLFK